MEHITTRCNGLTSFAVDRCSLCVFLMNRKPSPYKVVTGKKPEHPPIYVKYIEHSPILLNGSAEEFERLELSPVMPYDDTGSCEKRFNRGSTLTGY